MSLKILFMVMLRQHVIKCSTFVPMFLTFAEGSVAYQSSATSYVILLITLFRRQSRK